MKKLAYILASLLGVVVVLVVSAVVMLSMREEKPPASTIPVDSLVVDKTYAEAANLAVQELQHSQATRHFPSVAMAVGVKGKLVWAGTVGFEEVASGRPATVNTRYYIASIAKFFTSVALGKLIETNTIDLDASFQQLVPDFPKLQYDFSVRQLQEHKAGIRHWRVKDAFNQTYYPSVRAAAADLEDTTLLFAPGTQTSYSTPGYTLLALAMEHASGKDYLSLMQQLVFAPAGMQSIVADTPQRPSEQVVVPYLVHDTAMVRLPNFNVSDRWAGGGFLSTPSDVVRFGNAVLAGDMISESYRSALLRREPADAEQKSRYPHSFTEENSSSGLKLTGGGTGWTGRASLSLYPERGIVVAIATNSRPSDDKGPGIDEDQIAALFDAAVP